METATPVCTAKGSTAGHEQATSTGHTPFENQPLQVLRNRHRPTLPVLGSVIVDLPSLDGASGQAFGLIPTGTSSETQHRDGIRVGDRACFALLQQQRHLIRLDLADLGQGLCQDLRRISSEKTADTPRTR